MPKIPNATWLAVIAGLQLLIGQSYPDLWWSPVALAACIAAIKLLQVQVETPEEPPATVARSLAPAGMEQDEPASKLRRWLVE